MNDPSVAGFRGRHGGRPPAIDADSLIHARALQAAGTRVPDIAEKLTINTGKNVDRHPSVVPVYRAGRKNFRSGLWRSVSSER